MDDDIFRTGLISQARIEKPMLPDSLWIDLVMIEGGRGGETILWILVLRVIIIPQHCTADIGRVEKRTNDEKEERYKFYLAHVSLLQEIIELDINLLKFVGQAIMRKCFYRNVYMYIGIMFLYRIIIYRTIYRYCSSIVETSNAIKLILSKIENFHKDKLNGVFVYW